MRFPLLAGKLGTTMVLMRASTTRPLRNGSGLNPRAMIRHRVQIHGIFPERRYNLGEAGPAQWGGHLRLVAPLNKQHHSTFQRREFGRSGSGS